MIRAMRHVAAKLTATRFVLSARRDHLLEMLALHHQIAIRARSHRRFRPSDPAVAGLAAAPETKKPPPIKEDGNLKAHTDNWLACMRSGRRRMEASTQGSPTRLR